MKSPTKSRKAQARKAAARKEPPRKAGMILWIASILVAAIGVFWLPWYFSSPTPVIGESYALGFNNRVGVLALGMAILLATAACCFGARRQAAYQWFEATPHLFPAWKEAGAEYWILFEFCALIAAELLFWTSYLVDPAWCEARWFLYERASASAFYT